MKETKQQPLTLLAFSREDAYGVVREKGGLFHIKPPFSLLDNKEPISEQDLQNAISKLNYEQVEQPFINYRELTDYLENTAIATREQQGQKPELANQSTFNAYLQKMPPVVFKDAVGELEQVFEQGDYGGLIFQAKAMLRTIYKDELQEELQIVQSWLDKAEQASLEKYRDTFPNLNEEDNARVATLSPLGVQSRA